MDNNINVRAIFMPSMELFSQQESQYKSDILDKTKNIFRAGSKQSWGQWMKKDDVFIGLDRFGVSGPGNEVFLHFEISVKKLRRNN